MPTNITIRNTNQRNQIKVSTETSSTDPKTKKVEWGNTIHTYLKPGETLDVWVAETRRTTVQELPT